jgi:hypothetical protein
VGGLGYANTTSQPAKLRKDRKGEGHRKGQGQQRLKGLLSYMKIIKTTISMLLYDGILIELKIDRFLLLLDLDG